MNKLITWRQAGQGFYIGDVAGQPRFEILTADGRWATYDLTKDNWGNMPTPETHNAALALCEAILKSEVAA